MVHLQGPDGQAGTQQQDQGSGKRGRVEEGLESLHQGFGQNPG